MRKDKYRNAIELIKLLREDSTMDNVTKPIRCLTYAPNLGYRIWIFKYNGTLVALGDLGNGHYAFHSTVSYWDLIKAWFAVRRIG